MTEPYEHNLTEIDGFHIGQNAGITEECAVRMRVAGISVPYIERHRQGGRIEAITAHRDGHWVSVRIRLEDGSAVYHDPRMLEKRL